MRCFFGDGMEFKDDREGPRSGKIGSYIVHLHTKGMVSFPSVYCRGENAKGKGAFGRYYLAWFWRVVTGKSIR
jgi:hypothetical protein